MEIGKVVNDIEVTLVEKLSVENYINEKK